MKQQIFHKFKALLEFKKEYQLKSSGLNYTQLHVLEYIFEYEGRKTLEISRALSISPSTLIGILDELESKGYIKRERQKSDKRVVIVTASEKGNEVVTEHIREDECFLENLTAMLSDVELEQFYQLMEKIVVNVKDPNQLFGE